MDDTLKTMLLQLLAAEMLRYHRGTITEQEALIKTTAINQLLIAYGEPQSEELKTLIAHVAGESLDGRNWFYPDR